MCHPNAPNKILFLRGPVSLKYDRKFAGCPSAEEHCKLRPPFQPPGRETATSSGPFKMVKLSNRHRF